MLTMNRMILERIGGYELIHPLVRGVMGTVHLIRQEEIRRRVALKNHRAYVAGLYLVKGF